MVTSETGKLRVFGPDVFFIETLALRAPGQALHGCGKLHRLANAPFAYARPDGILCGLSRRRLARNFPVARHHRREGIKLKIQIRMPGRDHLMIDKLVSCPEMAFQAFLRATTRIAGSLA